MNKATKKVKVFCSFRLEPDIVEKLDKFPEQDPTIFSSKARIVDAALSHFFNLSKTEQKRIIAEYLTRKF